MTSWCAPLHTFGRGDLAYAGGKGANLGALIAAGFDVPPGFVVTTDAYLAAVAALDEVNADTVAAVDIPADVDAALIAAVRALGEGPVAVRSSATAEDLPGATFAGQQDTFLGVIGDDALRDAVRRCWASLWSERAVAYRARLGIPADAVAIAVVVQQMVPADHAGVLFTADPVTGARDRLVIESNPGLGEAVVSGLVTPERIVVDPSGDIVTRTPGRGETIIRSGPGGGTRVEHSSTEAPPAPLSDPAVGTLARIGGRIAEHFGAPQDIEWAVTGGRVHILQARPLTALPPAPIALSRIQRLTGPVLLELLPRRPYPLELTAWTLSIGRHVQGMLDGIGGIRLDFSDIIPAQDGIVQEFVPYRPHPTRRTPSRLARTLAHLHRDPRTWRDDPRFGRYRAAARALEQQDPRELTWADLLAVPRQAAHASDLVTALRIRFLPPAGAAVLRLRLALTLLGRRSLFSDLLFAHRTMTQQANDELAAIAADIRADDALARRIAERDGAGSDDADGDGEWLDGERLWETVRAQAPTIRERVDAFLTEFGHRETGSILLAHDPTWGDDPGLVMSLVRVLIGDAPPPQPQRFAQARAALLAHPVVRWLRLGDRLDRAIDAASAAVLVREDSHFELSRTMPAVRRALNEAGRRLADAGVLDAAADVWFLTYAELRATSDPALAADDPHLTANDPVAASGDPTALRAAVARRRVGFAQLAGSPLIAPTTLYPDRRAAGATVAGTPGGGGLVEGTVRIIRDATGFGDLRPGEVLVCPATNPAWTPLFARAAAVVVDNGAVASHAAIVAREYGIAAVMGTGNGTTLLHTGDRVRVDGDLGTVHLIR